MQGFHAYNTYDKGNYKWWTKEAEIQHYEGKDYLRREAWPG